MFNGEESVRIRTDLPKEKLEEIIEDCLGRVGAVEFFKGGRFEIISPTFKAFASDAKVDGQLSPGRKEGEWNLRVSYSVQPNVVCWVIAVVGFLFVLIGPLILLIPFLAKGEIQKKVGQALQEVEDETEPSEGKS